MLYLFQWSKKNLMKSKSIKKGQIMADNCFGIACPYHSTCALYAAVEKEHLTEPILTCIVNGKYTLFRPIIIYSR